MRNVTHNHELSNVIKHWEFIAPIIHYPKNEKQYDKLVTQLNSLLDIVGENENHPLMGLIDVISNYIEDYENVHFKNEQEIPSGLDALIFLMESNNLSQSDLPEIGSQGVVSEILNGKRQLNLRQIVLLAKRFNVDVSTFVDNN